MTGQSSHRADISGISNALPCVVETTEEHGYSSGAFVRLTNLNGAMPTPRGQDPLNNHRYRIVVTGVDEFYIKDPITDEPIDSSSYPPYVEGGYCNLIETNFTYHGDDEDD
jgi:hypothetical protein